MDVRFEVDLACPREVAFAELEDLRGCSGWLGFVRRVEPDGDGWFVDVGARLGLLVSTKRVRMVRTVHDPPSHLRFERIERDGRVHSPWVLDATVTAPEVPGGDRVDTGNVATGNVETVDSGDTARSAGDANCRVVLVLHHGGSSLAALLGPVLRAEGARALPALRARIEERNRPRPS